MDIYSALAEVVGEENVSQNELDLLCYSHDLAPMPEELLHAYGMIPPLVVVRPKNIEEVSKILVYANKNKIPINTRGGGSWALGGTLPIEGGIVLDISGMDRILELNEKDEYVKVEGGVVWKHLMDYLEKKSFEIGPNPSSSPSATIAGFISTGGGGGIGVSRYGTMGDQILSMKVVLSDGRIIETNHWDSWYFVGSEGTLGVIGEISLKVYPLRKKLYYVSGYDSVSDGMSAFKRLYELKPLYLTFMDRGFIECLNEKGHNLPEKELTVVSIFETCDNEKEYLESKVDEICGNTLYDTEVAKEEWENRFSVALSIKSLGPTLFSPEIQMPIKFVKEAFEKLEKLISKRKHAVEAMATDTGTVTILPTILTDERDMIDFLNVFSLTGGINKIGYKYHGCVYGIGLWNTPHMRRIHKNGFKVMQALRKKLDPARILNPSKTTRIRVPGYLQNMFMLMMDAVPGVVAAVLKLLRFMPTGFLRFGLRLMGGQLK